MKIIFVSAPFIISMFFISNSYGYEVTETNLIEMSNKINKTMPRYIDKATTIITTKVKPSLNLEYLYEINIPTYLKELAKIKKVNILELKELLVEKYGSLNNFFIFATKKMAEKEKNRLCTNKNRGAHRLIKKGVIIKHIYYDEAGEYLSSNVYNKNTCS